MTATSNTRPFRIYPTQTPGWGMPTDVPAANARSVVGVEASPQAHEAAATDLARRLGRTGMLQVLLHPRQSRHDRHLRACALGNASADADLAGALAALPKTEQRETAEWMAEAVQLKRMPQDACAAMAQALSRVPRALRRGVWELAHYTRCKPGWYLDPLALASIGQSPDPAWLGRMATLPPHLLEQWTRWLPRLRAKTYEDCCNMAWLFGLPAQGLAPTLRLALQERGPFDDCVARLQSPRWFMSDELTAAVLQRLHVLPAPQAGGIERTALEALSLDLECLGRGGRFLEAEAMARCLLHLHDGDAGTQEAIRLLAEGSQRRDARATLWALDVPLRYRERVARMFLAAPLENGVWERSSSLRELHPAICTAVFVAWAGRNPVGYQARAQMLMRAESLTPEVAAHVETLHDAGADIETAGLWVEAAAQEASADDAVALAVHMVALARDAGWPWTAVARALTGLSPALRVALVERVSDLQRRTAPVPSAFGPEGPLGPRSRARTRILQLSDAAWALARQAPQALEDTLWLHTLERLTPADLERLSAASSPAAKLEALLGPPHEPPPLLLQRLLQPLRPSAEPQRARMARLLQPLLEAPEQLPALCAAAPALALHPSAEPLFEQLRDLLPALSPRTLGALAALPSEEQAPWLECVRGSRDPHAVLRALADADGAASRATLLRAEEALGALSNVACKALRALFASLPRARRSSTTAALCRLVDHFRGWDTNKAYQLLEACCAPHQSPHTPVLLEALLHLAVGLPPIMLRRRHHALLLALQYRTAPIPRAVYERDWATHPNLTAAFAQTALWIAEPAHSPPPREPNAHNPYDRQQQADQRAAALAAHRLIDLTEPEAVQAATLRGAHELAALLGARANLPPHQLYPLQQRCRHPEDRMLELSELQRAQGAVHAWGDTGPFPAELAEVLRRNYLPLNCQTLPGLFAYCDSLQPSEALATPLRIAALETVGPPGGAQREVHSFTCAVCDEAADQRTRLVGCTCAPALCDGCAAQAVALVPNRLTCPTACAAPLNREYLERLGVAPALRQQRLVALHRERLSRVPEWALASEGLSGRYDRPPPVRPDEIPAIRPGQDPQTLRLLLSGLAAWPNYNGDGVHRECYTCAQPVMKGELCLHMQCQGAEPHHWDFERGPYNGQPRFATAGLGAQGYIPLARGPLSLAGFYDGLPAGVAGPQTLQRVQRRREAWLTQLGGAVQPQAEA